VTVNAPPVHVTVEAPKPAAPVAIRVEVDPNTGEEKLYIPEPLGAPRLGDGQ
jgi:hypothetical protein